MKILLIALTAIIPTINASTQNARRIINATQRVDTIVFSDGTVLSTSSVGGNINPANITQTPQYRFITDTERAAWDAMQPALGFTPENTASKDQPNGYAGLEANGLLPISKMPVNGTATANIIFEEFLNSSGFDGGLMNSAGNGGSSSVQGSLPNAPGVLRLVTGTTSNNTGYSSLGFNAASSALSLGSGSQRGRIYIACRIRPALALFSGSAQGHLLFGLGDGFTATLPTDGVYFQSTDGGVYTTVTRQNNVETATATSVSPILNTWVTLEILISSDASTVRFWINNIEQTPHTTNIPNGTSRSTSVVLNAAKRGTAHAVSAGFDIDWFYLKMGTENTGILFTPKY